VGNPQAEVIYPIMSWESVLETLLHAVEALLLFLLGDAWLQLAYVLVACAIDTYYGVKVAKKTEKFTWSNFVRMNQEKYIAYFFLIVLSHVIDASLCLNNVVRTAMVVSLIQVQVYSVMRHLSRLGLNDLADLFRDILKSIGREGRPSEDFETLHDSDHRGCDPD
jgi:phage-related holin